MNTKSLILLVVIVSIVTMVVSCSSFSTISETSETVVAPVVLAESNDQQIITYYLLNKPATNNTFCDGATMDSVGYKTALTKKITQTVPGTFTSEDKIKTTLGLAAEAQAFNAVYTRTASTTFANGIVTMHSENGWAGSSIFYCAWKPFVEKNLAQFPEVKEIKWETAISQNDISSCTNIAGYPVFHLKTPSITREKQLLHFSLAVPCEGIDLSQIKFEVHSSAPINLGKENQFAYQVSLQNKVVGKVSVFMSGDVEIKNDMALRWDSGGLVLPGHAKAGQDKDWSLTCLNCAEAFPVKSTVTACLSGATWDSAIDDGRHSQTYYMGSPTEKVCQTTQF